MASEEEIVVEGLLGSAEIVVDRWGIPHIFAGSTADAFFAQGFNAGRDRLWQIDMWRRRGLGLVAEAFGPAYVERDRAARLILYRGDMAAEWACYGPDSKELTKAFVAGINAWIDLVEREPSRLPIEFRKLGYRPLRWQAEDVVRIRGHARVRNLEMEIPRAEIVGRFGLEASKLFKMLEPEWETAVPEGFEPGPLPPEVLSTYALATGYPVFSPERVEGVAASEASAEGSNNWALAPSRTTTGRAILASDPHRVHEQPSLRYIAHLSAPGLNVIGAGEPNVPGVSFGHNERIAFGLTIHPIDQEDLFVYELDPADPTRYRYRDGWEAMHTVTERIPVRGADAVEAELRFTRHGPVLHADPESGRAYALRTVWTEPGTAAYLASLNYIRAGSWDEFTDALDGWGAPAANQVYADVDGNIGWSAAGFAPIRLNWDGLMPVPGDGRYEWRGFLPADEMPRLYNPSYGWVGSANQMNLPPDFDYRRHKTCFEWTDGARFARLKEALTGQERFSIEDTKALQTDFMLVPGRRICALLRDLGAEAIAPAVRTALDLLRSWDHRLDPDSAAGALFEVWFSRHLLPATFRHLMPAGMPELVATPDTALAVELLEEPDERFGAEPAAARDKILLDSLSSAVDDLAKRLGPDPAEWSWGRLHHGYFEHPLSAVLGEEMRARLDVGPAPKGGSNFTINNNNYRITDFRVTSGVTFRMVVDVGNWDASWTLNAPGQSGDPESPHYRDLFESWAREEYVPMLFSREAIEAAAERRIRLVPPKV